MHVNGYKIVKSTRKLTWVHRFFLDFSHIKVPDIVKLSSDITRKIQQIWLIKWENVLNG